MNQFIKDQIAKLFEGKVVLILTLDEFEELRLAAVPNLIMEEEECTDQQRSRLLTCLRKQLHQGPRKGEPVMVINGVIN